MKLNEKILFCRKRAGLSQEALAEVIGVSRQTVSKWETGEAAPEITRLPLLAKTFGVTADWLLSQEDPPEPEPAQPEEPPREGSQPFAGAAPAPWVEAVPGVLGRLIHRYGWLLGLRLAIGGALFTAMGLLMRGVWSSFGASMDNLGGMGSFGGSGFLSSGDILWTDEFGNLIDSPFGGQAAMTDPGILIANFVLILGIVMLVGGVILAVVLKNRGEAR